VKERKHDECNTVCKNLLKSKIVTSYILHTQKHKNYFLSLKLYDVYDISHVLKNLINFV